jgi:Ni,Fe-hydrogenase III component G
MTRDDAIESICSRFAGDLVDLRQPSPRRAYLEVHPRALVAAARHLFQDLGARFNIASASDLASHMEILYHFTLEDVNLVVSLRVKLDRAHPVVDSLAPSFEAANWIEREMHELLGIDFRGHPDLRRLLLPDQWPEGVHPLRQDYEEWDPEAVRDRGV